MKKYVCDLCGWDYDEAEGYQEGEIAPGTKFEDLPDDFVCPLCGASKAQFSEAYCIYPRRKVCRLIHHILLR